MQSKGIYSVYGNTIACIALQITRETMTTTDVTSSVGSTTSEDSVSTTSSTPTPTAISTSILTITLTDTTTTTTAQWSDATNATLTDGTTMTSSVDTPTVDTPTTTMDYVSTAAVTRPCDALNLTFRYYGQGSDTDNPLRKRIIADIDIRLSLNQRGGYHLIRWRGYHLIRERGYHLIR